METIKFLGNVLDFVVFGTIRLLTSWTVFPIALGVLIWYSRSQAGG